MNRIYGLYRLLSKAQSTTLIFIFFAIICFCGCGDTGGYSNSFLYPEDIRTVYVQMFDNQSFYRGIEYELTDALAKRIEAETPYKIISSPDHADTVISGKITTVGQATLSSERQTGRALEKELEVRAIVSWKNLKSGRLMVNNEAVAASASYSEWQNQSLDYASILAANNLARRIVELMESKW